MISLVPCGSPSLLQASLVPWLRVLVSLRPIHPIARSVNANELARGAAEEESGIDGHEGPDIDGRRAPP